MGVTPVPPPQAPTYDPCGTPLLSPSLRWQCLARSVFCSSSPVWHSFGRHRLHGQTAEAVSLRLCPKGSTTTYWPCLLLPPGAAPGLSVALPRAFCSRREVTGAPSLSLEHLGLVQLEVGQQVPDRPLVLSQQSDSGLGWHGERLPSPPTTLPSTRLGGTVCTATLLGISVSPLQDGGELHSSVSGSGSGEAGYISQMLTWIQLPSLLQFLPQW